MSGHSKWSQIKRKKGFQDRQKGNIFAKFSRLITLAVVEGGNITDPTNNVRLRLAIDKAKSYNMPKENIARAIERAHVGNQGGLKEYYFEAFTTQPQGGALIIHATTDNANRTISFIRTTLERYHGKLSGLGSALFLFQKCSRLEVEKNKINEDAIFLVAQKFHAFDIQEEGPLYILFFPQEFTHRIREEMGDISFRLEEVYFKAKTTLPLADKNLLGSFSSLISELRELNDVHEVFSNISLPTLSQSKI